MFRSTAVRVDRELQRLRLKLPAYRYADRTVSSAKSEALGAWHAVSEDSLARNNSLIASSEYFRRFAPPSFISRRMLSISPIPPFDRCFPFRMSCAICLNLAKSRCFFADRKPNWSKNGMTLSTIAVNVLTSLYQTPSGLDRIVPHFRC